MPLMRPMRSYRALTKSKIFSSIYHSTPAKGFDELCEYRYNVIITVFLLYCEIIDDLGYVDFDDI